MDAIQVYYNKFHVENDRTNGSRTEIHKKIPINYICERKFLKVYFHRFMLLKI